MSQYEDERLVVKQPKAALGFIFISVFLDVLSFGVIIPVLLYLLEDMLNGDTALATRYLGVFGTAWALMQFVCAPIMGSLSDRFGRRPVLLLSSFGLGVDYILMAVAPSVGWLFLGRVLSGITAASFSTAGAYIADITPPEKRAASYGIFGAAFGLGFVIGPALGGWLGSYGLRVPFWVSAALTLTNALYGLFILPESLSKEKRQAFSWSRANPIGSLVLLRSQPGLFGLAMIGFLYQLAHQVLQNVFVPYSKFRFDWSPKVVGLSLGAVGVCSIIVQGALVRPLIRKLGERRMLITALSFGIAGFLWFGCSLHQNAMWMGILVLAGMGFFSPAWQGLMTRRVSHSEQGQLQGAGGSLAGIAGMVGPTLFTSIFSSVTPFGKDSLVLGAPFFLAAGMLGIGLSLAIFVTRPQSSEANA